MITLLIGTRQHFSMLDELPASPHFTTVTCGVDFDYRRRSWTMKTSRCVPPPFS